ncbi:MAG: hypothetical protein JNK04_09125 [Myxococcales bacterium]|nr:hypothetical protein [Myxococcales bacterium]
MRSSVELESLMREVARALWAGECPKALRSTLVELARDAEPGSNVWRFAHRELALTVSDIEPWRASILARRLLSFAPSDHVGWATLALSQSLLGNLAYAVRCYERALAIAPHQPRYQHNLGHLYDIALDQPERALPLLERAHHAEPKCSHVAASLAHALGRTGRAEEGLRVLRRAVQGGATKDQTTLLAWLEQEAERPARTAEARSI